MGATVQTTAEHLVEIADHLYISKLLSGVAVTWVLYDWILVFQDEFSTIYQSRWSLAKCLLFYIRFVSPPCLIIITFTLADFRPGLSSKVCVAWLYILTFGIYTTLLASNGLLSLRLVALYSRKRLVTWFIGGFYFVTYAATLGLIIDGLPPVGRSISYNNTVDMCTASVTTNTLRAVFYAPAAFEAFLFGLTAYSVLADAPLIIAAGGVTSTPFLTVFYRDGILCFLVTVGLRILNIWIYLTQHVSTYNMGIQLMWAANVVLITRVYMNLVWLVKGDRIADAQIGYSTDSNEIQTRGTTNIFRMRRQTPGGVTSVGVRTSEIGSRYSRQGVEFSGTADDGRGRCHLTSMERG